MLMVLIKLLFIILLSRSLLMHFLSPSVIIKFMSWTNQCVSTNPTFPRVHRSRGHVTVTIPTSLTSRCTATGKHYGTCFSLTRHSNHASEWYMQLHVTDAIEMIFYGMLRSVDWYLIKEVSRQPVGPISPNYQCFGTSVPFSRVKLLDPCRRDP